MIIDPGREIRLNHVILAVGRLRPGDDARAGPGRDERRRRTGEPAVSGDEGVGHPARRLLPLLRQPAAADRARRAALRGRLRAADRLRPTSRTCCWRARRRGRRKSRCARRWARAADGCSGSCSSRASCSPTIGGAAGLLVALWAVDAINAIIPPTLLPVPDVQIDATVLLFALGLTVVTGLLFGIAPAWHARQGRLERGSEAGDARVERRAPAPAQRSRRRGARARDDSFDRRRPAGAEPAAAAARQPRLPARSAADLPALAAADEVSGREEHRVLSRAAGHAARHAGRPRCRRVERHPVRQRRLHADADRDHRTVAVAAGDGDADRLAGRHAGIFPGDEHPVAARPRLR